ncbi:MAG: hypothetical protein QM820_27755 [Minicystis sp.]
MQSGGGRVFVRGAGRGALLLIAAAAGADTARAAEDRRPAVTICADLSRVGHLRTRLESDLAGKETAERYAARLAHEALHTRYRMFRFEIAPECGATQGNTVEIALESDGSYVPYPSAAARMTVLVRSTAGAAERIDLGQVARANPPRDVLLIAGEHDHRLRIDRALAERLDRPEPPLVSLRVAMSKIPIPLPESATRSAKGEIVTSLTFADLGISPQDQVLFEVEVGDEHSQRRLFHACGGRRAANRDNVIAGPIVDKPDPSRCESVRPSTVTLPPAPPAGWKWGTIFAAGQR